MFNQLRGNTRPAAGRRGGAGPRDLRHLPHAAPHARTSIRRSTTGSRPTSSRGGCAWGVVEKFAEAGTQTSVETGAGGVLLVRGDDGELRAVRQRLPTPRPRAGAVWRHDAEARPSSSAPTTRGPTSSTVRCATRPAASATSRTSTRVTVRTGPSSTSWNGTAGCSSTPAASRGPSRTTRRGSTRSWPTTSPRTSSPSPPTPTRSKTNWKIIVENYQECYHCPLDPPRAVPGQPAAERGEPRARRRVDGRLDGSPRPTPPTMSLDGTSGGVAIAGLNDVEPAHGHVRRGLPQPAHLAAPRLRDDPHAAADRRLPAFVECSCAFPREAAERPRLRPRPTPSTSGTSPTARTGRRASPCSAGSHQPARDPRAHGARRRTASTSSSAAWPARTPASAAPTTPARR